MVKEIKSSSAKAMADKKNDTVYYQCEECGFFYKEKEIAEKCQAWCKENHSCNIEITKHAIQLEG